MTPPRHRPTVFRASAGGSWEIGLAQMPAFVPDDDGERIRPLVAMVMEASGRIRATALGHPDRPAEALEKALREAIQHPLDNLPPGPPPRVVVPDERVPAVMRAKVDALMGTIDAFCDRHLNPEYRQLIHAAVCALARKRPSQLLSGREAPWCAGVVHAIGMANVLFDKTQIGVAPILWTGLTPP